MSAPKILCSLAWVGLILGSAQTGYSTEKPKDAQPSINFLTKSSDTLNAIARRASPAVVSVTTVKDQGRTTRKLDISSGPEDQATLGIGSGVIIRPDGLILTNHHVVENAERVTVNLDEKHKVSATVLGSDSKTDLAVIRIQKPKGSTLSTLPFGDSDKIRVGDWSIAVGSPFGLSHTVTLGIISAVGRAQLGMLDIEDFIQTSAAINPGNSGGPLLNAKGEMIGINTAIFSESGGFVGIGFSIPSRIAKQVFEEIVHNGRVIRGWIGISAQDVEPDLSHYFKVAPNRGAIISRVKPKGPAANAKLKEGDVVIRYGSYRIESANQLKKLVASSLISSKIPIEISRDGQIKKLEVAVLEQPGAKDIGQQAGRAARERDKNPRPYWGVTVQDIPPEFSKLFGIPPDSGALVTQVRAGGPAFDAGLTPGDIILKANQTKINNSRDFQDAIGHLAKKDEATVFYVQRGPEDRVFMPIKPLIH